MSNITAKQFSRFGNKALLKKAEKYPGGKAAYFRALVQKRWDKERALKRPSRGGAKI